MKYLLLIFLVCFNIFIWNWVIAGEISKSDLDIYFLDVGQGDSSLIELPEGMQMLIDGGPGNEILSELEKILPPTDRYIDLVLLSHPEADHFTGLIPVMERYKIGAFIYNGRDGESKEWQELTEIIKSKNIPVVVLKEGDKITYGDSSFKILSPNNEFINEKELNNTSLVGLLESENIKTLFTGDIGFATENYITDNNDLDIDVLKVAHHGSKYSTGLSFLTEATPYVSIIEVGENKHGHPTEDTLNRLAQVGSSIYRNDEDGLIHLKARNGQLNIFK